MARIEKTVFISYRRKDISWALAVYQDLTHHGYDVFFDYTSIPSGDFEQIIISNIRARAHFVLILTPTTFDRCSEPGDWLRREVEVAIDEKRNITPLFFDDFNFGNDNVSQKLTGKLKNVRRYNGMNVHQDYFTEAMNRLRTKFLSVPLDAILHPVSIEVQEVVAEEKRAANKAAKDAKKIAERDSSRKRQNEVVGKIISLISSNFRWFGIGGIILFVLIFGGFSLNYLINNMLFTTTTMPSPTVKTATISSVTNVPTFKPPTLTNLPFTLTPSPTETPIPIPTLAPGSTVVSEKDGMVLIYVPAGEFTMGDKAKDAQAECEKIRPECRMDWFEDEEPPHKVDLDAFWIDRTEVTNAMYAKCVATNKCYPPRNIDFYGNSKYANRPVVNVTWSDAFAYCSWADRKLPTEAEWEKAARGEDQRMYPWGNDAPNANLLNYDSAVSSTKEVGTYPAGASFYGALDMAGNAWEWVNDWYDIYPGGTSTSSDFGHKYRVLRGGSWNYVDFNFRSAFRNKYDPVEWHYLIGFRCAQSVMP